MLQHIRLAADWLGCSFFELWTRVEAGEGHWLVWAELSARAERNAYGLPMPARSVRALSVAPPAPDGADAP